MTDLSLAGRAAAVLQSKPAARMLVPENRSPENLARAISSVLPDLRLLVFDFDRDNPIRTSLKDQFTGDGLPDSFTAFEAGWRAHCTELSLVSHGRGMEAAAGLQLLKEPLRKFLNGTGTGLPGFTGALLSSFSLGLPSLIIAGGSSGVPAGFLSLFDEGDKSFPPLLILSGEMPAGYRADSVLGSCPMTLDEIGSVLKSSDSSVSPLKALEATSGERGCVRLYAGIKAGFPATEGHLESMLRSVFLHDRQLMSLAAAAAVLGERFILDDAMEIAGLSDPAPFQRGKTLGLWKGHLVPCFHSDAVRALVMGIVPQEKLRVLYMTAAGTVRFKRPESSAAQVLAGELHIRAGLAGGASCCLEKAAALECSSYRAAHLYRQAAGLNREKSHHLLVLSALCFFREGMKESALGVLNHSDCEVSGPALNLRLMCEKEGLGRAVPAPADESCPDMDSAIVTARMHMNRGEFHRAETLLAIQASMGESPVSAAALVEMGECLLGRNMFNGALNVSAIALRYSRKMGLEYLESRALVVFTGAANRTGRPSQALEAVFRLLELAMISGNPIRFAHALNLMANTVLLCRQYSRALGLYRRAMGFIQGGEHNLRALVHNNMSIAQRKLLMPREALSSLVKLVHETVSAGDLSRACVGYGNLARLFIDLSEFDSASDCLETMVEMAALGRVSGMDEPTGHIAAQIAFSRGHYAEAFELIDRAALISRGSGNRRRLSLNLVRKGSMLLRAGMAEEAEPVLEEAAAVSRSVSSLCNAFVADMKLAVARCLLKKGNPACILSLEVAGNPDDNHRGEQFYHHWKLTGSRQSLAAAAQFLSRGLSGGLHHHSYMYMLDEIAAHMPPRLADAVPLLHNYTSRIHMKGG